jgi:hypothetical protein
MKSLDLQLRAARSLVQPRLDFVGSYRVNGFGDDLIAYNGTAGDNFYESITQGDQTGWNLGLQMNWPIGFRSAMAQVRNYELRMAKAQKVLQEQEREIALELAASFQELARAYTAAEKNMNRLIAARENVRYLEPNIRLGTLLLDELLRAQLRQAEAEVAYYQSLIEYNKALNDLQFRKGTLLEHNSVYLAEGGWRPEAYYDANRKSKARNYAHDADLLLEPVPEPFAAGGPVGGVYFTAPQAIGDPVPTPIEDPQSSPPEPMPPLEEPVDSGPYNPQPETTLWADPFTETP